MNKKAYTYDYPRPAVTADCVVFCNDLVANGYIVAKGRWSVINTGDGTGFKSKPCTYSVGCDCTGFKASGTYAPEKFICKKCGHHKDYHH